MSPREPILKTIEISDLRPTQITVGMREVEEKREHCARTRKEQIGASSAVT